MTLYAGWVDKNKAKVIAGFALLGLSTLYVELRQASEAGKREQQEIARQAEEDALRREQARTLTELAEEKRETLALREKLESTANALGDSNAEQQRLLRQARESQERIGSAQAKNLALSSLNLELARKNTSLAEEAIQRTIGDPDNPPYLRFYDYDFKNSTKPEARAYLINSSNRYAARSVSLTIVLENQTYTSQSQDIPPSAGSINSRVPVEFPSTGLFDSLLIGLPGLSEIGASKVIEVRLTTAAGIYRQRIALRRVSEEQVAQAWRVYREGDFSRPIFARQELIFPQEFKWPEHNK